MEEWGCLKHITKNVLLKIIKYNCPISEVLIILNLNKNSVSIWFPKSHWSTWNNIGCLIFKLLLLIYHSADKMVNMELLVKNMAKSIQVFIYF